MNDNYQESAHAHRKDEHLSLAILQWKKRMKETAYTSDLSRIQFERPLIPDLKVSDIDLSQHLFGCDFKWPFYIEAMTGGSKKTNKINQKLASIAKKYQLAMAVGSESIALKEKETRNSFLIVREENPDGFIFANIGAGHDLSEAKQAVDLVEADALEIHLNAVQELSMNDGDRDFTNWKSNISKIIEKIGLPVVLKEVGFGMSEKSIEELSSFAPAAINIAGSSGTDFGTIEEQRNRDALWTYNISKDPRNDRCLTSNHLLGISTLKSLRAAKKIKTDLPIIANGGISSSLEVFNSLALGARLVGVAGFFLYMLNQDKLEDTIKLWQKQLPLLYAIYGVKGNDELRSLKELDI